MREKKTAVSKKTITITLVGNPNVGKSTLFNSLTGMNVHTGNWAGKTVGCESRLVEGEKYNYRIIDIPGTYSLISHSEEERIARNHICFSQTDITVVVCDSTALMQNLNLALQIAEIGKRAVLCLNLCDEADRAGISVDEKELSRLLSIPTLKTVAHKKSSAKQLLKVCTELYEAPDYKKPFAVTYHQPLEKEIESLANRISEITGETVCPRFLAARLISSEDSFSAELLEGFSEQEKNAVLSASCEKTASLMALGISRERAEELIVEAIVTSAERIAKSVVSKKTANERSRKIDKVLTGRISAYPMMLLLLFFVFFITLSLSSYPSEWLGRLFVYLEGVLGSLFARLGFGGTLSSLLLEGVFRTVGRVISVMMPPMVIFFPLFAILEDSGYLPRIAYNLDRPFACVGACGKQALTMCMGFGCNAVGVVGCRIIDSKRERLLAVLTNSLVPCNGRFPMIITFIGIFYLFFTSKVSTALSALTLSLLITFSIAMTFFSTAFLSKTFLRGEQSAFTIELPPYRRPRFLSVILRSLSDKCLSVLLRAVAVSAPVGILIWLLANLTVGDNSVISILSEFLDPLGGLLGFDGTVLLAFVLGIPANEIVIPIIIMIYSTGASLGAEMGMEGIKNLLVSEGWGPVTVACAAVFALFHWPCSTTLLTVYKETKSVKMTFLAFLIPTVIGFLLCMVINFLLGIFI